MARSLRTRINRDKPDRVDLYYLIVLDHIIRTSAALQILRGLKDLFVSGTIGEEMCVRKDKRADKNGSKFAFIQ